MFDKETLEKTIRLWQPYYKEKLTLQDAEEIITNLRNFFGILCEWDNKDIKHPSQH